MKTATFDTTEVVVRPGSGVAEMVRSTVRAVSTWHKRRQAIRELSALSDRQLTDIGLVRADIPSVVDSLMK